MIYACHSSFSLKFGTCKIETLTDRAQELGIPALILSDINNASGCFDFIQACQTRNIKPVIGVEFRNGDTWLYTCIARNNEGFREINEYQSEYNFSKKDFPVRPPEFNHVLVIYPSSVLHYKLKEHERIGVRPSEINKVCHRLSPAIKERCVAFQPVTFCDADDVELHRHLRAMDHNTLLSMVSPEQMAGKENVFVSPDACREYYKNYPELLRNAEKLLNDCRFDFDFKQKKNK